MDTSRLNGAWSIVEVLAMNFGDDGLDVDAMLSFVVGADSEFYPQFGALYRREITEWAEEQRAEMESDDDLCAATMWPRWSSGS